MNDFGVMQYAAAGMDAQRSALDMLARNVAISESASPGHPVHTMQPQFSVAGSDSDDGSDGGDDAMFAASMSQASGSSDSAVGMSDSGNSSDFDGDGSDDDSAALPGQVAFAGGRPNARPSTGIDAVSEMVAVLGAQRAYEANASVFDTGKRLVEKTLELERT